MFDFMMTDEQLKLRDEARAFTKWVPKEMILDMDAEKIHFPHEYLKEAGRRNLLGIRLPKELGGRGLGWVDDGIVAEEVGVASYSLACLWGVGADIVCEAVAKFGTDELKQAIVVPLLKGDVYAAECLTEPRGGSDFFGAATTARKDGGDWVINGQKASSSALRVPTGYGLRRRIRRGPNGTRCFMVLRDGVESKYIYGLWAWRRRRGARFSMMCVPELTR